jgi:hypothetical protein
MTKHYELIDSVPWKHLPARNLSGFGLHHCLHTCLNPTQLNGMGDGYVDNRMPISYSQQGQTK